MVKSDLQRITRGLELTIIGGGSNDTDKDNKNNNALDNEQGGWSRIRTSCLGVTWKANGYLLPLYFQSFKSETRWIAPDWADVL